MSISNIKELFCKRVLESDNQGFESPSKKSTNDPEKKAVISKLTEVDAGITEYLTDNVGFSAVIKQRFSDFQVHEIDLDGNVVRLTNMDVPVHTVEEVSDDILEKSTWEELEKLAKEEVDSVEIDVTDTDKDKRRKIHESIKAKYSSKVTTNTAEKDDKKFLTITLGKEESRSQPWPFGLGKYLHFVLYKSNLDTVDAVNVLAMKLHTKAANLTYAGTKDKRGKTTQWVSMWHLDAKKLNSLNKTLRGMKVGNFVYKDSPLKLGDLQGNNFEIALRNVTADDNVIMETLTAFQKNGFLNYFGLQRFGNSAVVPTHQIGKAFIKGDFKTAVDLILKPREEKSYSDLKEARKIWWETRDAKKAFNVLRTKNKTIEGKLLMGLSKYQKNDYVNALENVPRNVRLLYLHSYQSFVWNKILSKRMQTYGVSVLEGDLVFTNKECKVNDELVEDETDDSSTQENKVRFISKDEVDKFEIFDVVHPLPGHKITYPNNVIKEWYESLLAEDDLSSEMFKQSVKQYTLSGTYRHIVKKVKDLTWTVKYYDTPETDLILSDTDKLEKAEDSTQTTGQFKALVLNFSLDSSTYATMALREILRSDTSSAHQASLNSYANNKRPSEDCEDVENKKRKEE